MHPVGLKRAESRQEKGFNGNASARKSAARLMRPVGFQRLVNIPKHREGIIRTVLSLWLSLTNAWR